MKKILIVLLTILPMLLSAQRQYMQKIKLISGDSITINIAEIRSATLLSGGGAQLSRGTPNTGQIYQTTTTFASIVSNSCGNLVQFSKYSGGQTQTVAVNPQFIDQVTKLTGVSRAMINWRENSTPWEVVGSYETVSNLLSSCSGGGSSPSGDNWGAQTVSITGQTLIGNGTAGSPLRVNDNGITTTQIAPATIVLADIAQNGASAGQIIKWNGTAWALAADNNSGGGGADNWGTQVVQTTGGSLTGTGTVGNPLQIATSGVTTTHIATGTIIAADINQMGASSGQVLKWNGSAWAPAADGGGTVITDATLYGDGSVGDPLGWSGAFTASPLTGSGTVLLPLGLANNAITASHLAPDAVANSEMADDAVGSAEIINGSVSLVDMAANSVDSNKIVNRGISMFDIGQNGATASQVLKWNGNMWIPSTDAVGSVPALTNTHIFVGNASNVATDVAMSQDATLANTGAVTVSAALNHFQITNFNTNASGVAQHNMSAPSSRQTMAPTASHDLTGIDIGATVGKMLYLMNTSAANSVTLKNQDAGSNVSNRFDIGADFVLGPEKAVVLIHDGSRWRISGSQTGQTDLSIANSGAVTLDVVSNTGTDVTIPAATNALAGLMRATDKAKLDFVAVTQAVDLDAIEAASHALQTISASGAGPTSYNVDLSAAGGTITFSEGSNIDLTRSGNTITVASTAGAGNYQLLRDDGADETGRAAANFISTSTINAVLTDDAGNGETEIILNVPADGITANEIAADAVAASEILAGAVGASEIATGGVVLSTGDVTGVLPIANGGSNGATAVAGFNNLSPSTTLGDVIAHNGTDDVRVAGNITTTKQFLGQTGTGAVSALPIWSALAQGDIPAATGGDVTGLLSNLQIVASAVGAAEVADNSLTATDLSVNVVSSVEGVTNDGGNIDIVVTGIATVTSDDGANTITIGAVEVDGSTTNEALTVSDGTDTEALGGQTLNFAATGIATVDYVPGSNTLSVGAVEVDGSTTNEVQTISANGAGPASYTVDLTLGGGGVTLSEGSNIDLTRAGNTITINSTSGSGNYQTMRDDGTNMTGRAAMNFVASATVATTLTDDAANGETEVLLTVPNDAITAAQIAADAVGASEIVANAVGSSEIATGAVDLASGDVTGIVPIANGGTNGATAVAGFNNLDPQTTVGDVISHDGTNSVRVAGNTTLNKMFLGQIGNGTISALPTWGVLVAGDIPNASGGDVTGPLTNLQIGAATVGSSEVTDNSLAAADLSVNVVSSVDGVTNDGGDIDLIAAGIVVLTPNDAANTITVSATEVDGSVSNEGSLSVAAGGGNDSQVQSNTSGSGTITISGGSGITVTEAGSTITIAASAGGTNYQTLRDDGTNLTQRAAANFVGTATVATTLTDDAANGETEVAFSIPTDAITAVELAPTSVTATELANASVVLSSSDVTGTLPIGNGGTNATTAAGARTNLGAAASGANTDITSIYLDNTGLKVKDTNASHGLIIAPGSDITADRTLTVTTGDANRTLTINGNTTLNGSNLGDQTWANTGTTTYTGTLSGGGGGFTIQGLGIVSISHTAGTVSITGTEVDGALTNEGSITVGAGGGNTSTLNSNTSGSTAVTISGGSGITITEVGQTITIAASGGGGTNYQTWRDDGVDATQRPNANFVSTSTITATLTDDVGNTETEVSLIVPTNGITGTELANGSVVLTSADVTGVLPVANGGVPPGTNTQTMFYSGTTPTATSAIRTDGATVGIGTAPTSSELAIAGAVEISSGAISQSAAGNVQSSLTSASIHQFNTTSAIEWAYGSANGGNFEMYEASALRMAIADGTDEMLFYGEGTFGNYKKTNATALVAAVDSAAVDAVMTLENKLASASAQAVQQIKVANNASGDAWTLWTNNTTSFSAGVENSGEEFVIAGSGNLDASQYLRISNAGLMAIGGVAPTAANLVITGGTTTNAPLRFTTGTNTTTIVNGNVEWNGTNLQISSGGVRYVLDKTLTGSASLNFPSTPAGGVSELTITVTGAALSDPVDLGAPNNLCANGGIYFAWVSAANTVKIRYTNTDINVCDPAAGTFKVAVTQF